MTSLYENLSRVSSGGEAVKAMPNGVDSGWDLGAGISSGLACVHETLADSEQGLVKIVHGQAREEDYLRLGEAALVAGVVATPVVKALAAGVVTTGVVLGGRALAAGLEDSAATRLNRTITAAFSDIKLIPGANDIEIPLLSQKMGRRAVLHTGPDFDPTKAHDLLVTMDGFTINKTEPDIFGKLSSRTGMSKTNGLDATADRSNFVNLHLHHLPQRALPGVHINEWQSPGTGVLSRGGLLNWGRPKYDDAQYGAEAVAALAKKMNINSINVAAYGDGAEFAPNLLHALASSPATRDIPLKSATLVGGTTFGSERVLPAKVLDEVVLVRGGLDPNFPKVGGPGPNTRFLPWLGHRNVLNSQPGNWAAMYNKAAGITGEPIVETGNGVTQASFVSADGSRKVTEYTLDGVGSTWPGRTYGIDEQGVNHESVVSQWRNGAGSDFNVNYIIAKLVKRGAIARDLAGVAG